MATGNPQILKTWITGCTFWRKFTPKKVCCIFLFKNRRKEFSVPIAGISVGKEKLKFKNDLTSLDDKLRIANKVNNKYLELGGWMKQKLNQKVNSKSDPF